MPTRTISTTTRTTIRAASRRCRVVRQIAEGDHAQDGEAFEDVARRIAVDHARDPVAVPGRALPGGQLLHALAAGGDGHEDRDGEHGLPVAVLPQQPQDEPHAEEDQREVRRLRHDVPDDLRAGPRLGEVEQRPVEGKDDAAGEGHGEADEAREPQDREDRPDQGCAAGSDVGVGPPLDRDRRGGHSAGTWATRGSRRLSMSSTRASPVARAVASMVSGSMTAVPPSARRSRSRSAWRRSR